MPINRAGILKANFHYYWKIPIPGRNSGIGLLFFYCFLCLNRSGPSLYHMQCEHEVRQLPEGSQGTSTEKWLCPEERNVVPPRFLSLWKATRVD